MKNTLTTDLLELQECLISDEKLYHQEKDGQEMIVPSR